MIAGCFVFETIKQYRCSGYQLQRVRNSETLQAQAQSLGVLSFTEVVNVICHTRQGVITIQWRITAAASKVHGKTRLHDVAWTKSEDRRFRIEGFEGVRICRTCLTSKLVCWTKFKTSWCFVLTYVHTERLARWSSEFFCRLGLLFRNPQVRHYCVTEGRAGQRIQGLKESTKGRDQWMNQCESMKICWFDSIDFFGSVLSRCFWCFLVCRMLSTLRPCRSATKLWRLGRRSRSCRSCRSCPCFLRKIMNNHDMSWVKNRECECSVTWFMMKHWWSYVIIVICDLNP